ncbi:MAG: rhomboid family intramembrane serine protease [Candidatus Rifleibacteriota bacterium]
MEIAYRLILYIIMANLGYMIFSLYRKGYSHYAGYISQLFFLLCLIILMVAKNVSGVFSVSTSLCGIFVVVVLPMFLQKQIDVLMAENRLDEIEPLARWKANLAWSELNVHLHKLARIARDFKDDSVQLEQNIRQLLDRGEPYDSMTRVFIGLIHFNNRNFEGMIRDLVVEGKELRDYSFEELLYLVRAYLETTRYEEAISAQIALEEKLSDPEDFSLEKQINLVISRMIFFAFLGWKKDFENLMDKKEEAIERLPRQIIEFWRGMCYFNSGEFSLGEQLMGKAMRDSEQFEQSENWLPFMRKRFFGLVENKEFIAGRLLLKLKEFEKQYSPVINEIISKEERIVKGPETRHRVTDILVYTIMVVSTILILTVEIEDLVVLIQMGANSSFLVQHGEYFRIFSCLFIHIGWLHLFMNLIALKFFGPLVETLVGWPIFLGIYFFSGVMAGVAAVYNGQILSAGASGAVLGLLSSAIVFQFFKVKGVESLSRNNNFSTLIFIMVINLLVGAVEQVVDNSAHIGGMLGGALISLILVPVLKREKLKKFASVLSIIFVLAFAGFSSYQMFVDNKEGRYPQKVYGYKSIENASQTIRLELPQSWKLDTELTDFRELVAFGPFKERFTALVSINDTTQKNVIKEHINQRTKELEQTEGLNLVSRKGPDKTISGNKEIYKIIWLISSGGSPISVTDYLVFDRQVLYLLRFFVGSNKHEAYKNIFKHALNSFNSPVFD